MTAKRVAFLIPALDIGGAERMVVRLATGLDRQRYAPIVVAFVRGTGRLEPLLHDAGIPTQVIAERRSFRAALPLLLLRWAMRYRPHVLLTFMFHANMAGRLVRALGRVPALVCSERVVGWESRLRIVVNRATVGAADLVTVNSQAGRRFWSQQLRIPLERIVVIYNGVDPERFSPAVHEADAPRIGVLGRLHVANGHAWFVDALAVLRDRFAGPWTCTFAGDGPEHDDLASRITQRRLGDRVALTGHCDQVPDFLRSLQVAAHPCLVSGMPNAVLEAMSCGLPIVATAVGGTPEIIEDGRSGVLVQPDDSLRTAEALAALLQDAARRRALGAAARERVVSRFSIAASVGQLEEVLQRVTRS